jgi:hypothetical protein
MPLMNPLSVDLKKISAAGWSDPAMLIMIRPAGSGTE